MLEKMKRAISDAKKSLDIKISQAEVIIEEIYLRIKTNIKKIVKCVKFLYQRCKSYFHSSSNRPHDK
jgi:hypothetical protein